MQGTSTAFVPLGVPDPASIDYPAGEPPSEAEVELGKVLIVSNPFICLGLTRATPSGSPIIT
jgi:hypothetical protein